MYRGHTNDLESRSIPGGPGPSPCTRFCSVQIRAQDVARRHRGHSLGPGRQSVCRRDQVPDAGSHHDQELLFADKQTSEFHVLQQGRADFAIGSTINWSPHVKELNLFALPFLFPSYKAVDAVQAGEPGRRLFNHIEQKGVIPIAWGENGFRELTNSKRPIRRPDDLHGLKVRVVGVAIFVEIFQALGAEPVTLNWGQAQAAFREGHVDAQENPIALIVPYRIWAHHRHVTLWRYAIDPVILSVSARTWAIFSREDQSAIRKLGEEIMAEQKKESREGLDGLFLNNLQRLYGMETVQLSPIEIKAFRDKTRPVYGKWAEEIGPDLVRSVEKILESVK